MEGNHGSAGETTMLQSPYEENAAVACLEFWYTIAHKSTISLFCLDDHLVERVTRYSMAHNGGVTKLTIKEEGGGIQEESRTQSIVWELESTNPESDGLWQVGQALVKANNLVVIAEKGEKDDGFAAIDDLFFKIDPEFLDHCKTMPPSVTTKYVEKKTFKSQANPDGTTTPAPNTSPSPSPLPNCNFDTQGTTCGWEVWQTQMNSFSRFLF